ncbi:hypothetical protein PAXINDRAFT_170519 [Paxillus involutus ATCC 200175]|uniref:Skg3/CAF120-like PH-like domain-containing protein n=1 Tax=Paxillus involutus ATCC 200175 TaxID=664439 RepID=A0A0C9TCZ5_PAXIN|nr:hypothetical protein PAXINDRAFT_170519 [Paxillus involutus ATCC 200175]
MGQSMSTGPRPQDQQLDQQQPTTARRNSLAAGQSAPPPLHPEIRSVVQLTLAHARKVYFSGPLVKRVERQADGQKPAKDEGWIDVWAQLGGTTLSIWDMREIEEANKQGKEVPPTYVNMTDAFVQVLGSISIPAADGQPPKKYTNVLTLNSAGSNLLLFSCPSTPALVSWATALRLSAWEKSRLEEIYTAHLIRITLPDGKDTRPTLLRGRMEGWVRIRVAGQTDWKRMWMIVSAGSQQTPDPTGPPHVEGTHPGSPNVPRKKRMSNLFSREHTDDLPLRPMVSLYASPKPKDKKKALLTLKDVTQAFAVYPERPELINRSTLMKLEGLLGDEETAGGMRGREGWLLVMPELEAGNTQASEMLKWLVALHDAFELYGRPKPYTWDPRDPLSTMFAYPVGPARDLLFLEREVAEIMNPREDRTSAIRSRLLNVLLERMRGADPQSLDGAPALPPLSLGTSLPSQQHPLPPPPSGQSNGQPLQLPQLPSLGFDVPATRAQSPPQLADFAIGRTLSPIAERSNTRETLAEFARVQGQSLSSEQPHGITQSVSESDENEPLGKLVGPPSTIHESGEGGSMLAKPIASSPPPASTTSRKLSGDSFGKGTVSRPDSKLSPSAENAQMKSTETSESYGIGASEVMGIKLPFSPLSSPESPSFSATSSMSIHSSGASRQVPQSPGSPGLSYLTPGAPTATPGKSTGSHRGSPAFSVLTSAHSLLEKDLPSIEAVQAETQIAQRVSSPLPRTLPRSLMPSGPISNTPTVPPVPDKPMLPQSQPHVPLPPSKPTISPAPAPATQDPQSVFTDALFYMQQLDDRPALPRRVPTTISENSDSASTSEHSAQNSRTAHGSLSGLPSSSQPTRRGTAHAASLVGSRPSLGRKPSGARAPPGGSVSRVLNPSVSSPEQQHLHSVHDSDTDTMSDDGELKAAHVPKKQVQVDDANADVLAALSFLDTAPAATTTTTAAAPQRPMADVRPRDAEPSPSPPPEASSQATENMSGVGSSDNAAQYKSTFAPSKQAAQRKARLQAQQAAHQAAVHRPGRANGKRVSSAIVGGWNESSDEEEEDEEEDEDADSDDEPSIGSKRPSQASAQASAHAPSPAPPAAAAPSRLRPRSRTASPAEPATVAATDANPYAQLRQPRNLPAVPRPQTQGSSGAPDDYFGTMPPQRRFVSDQRSRTPDEGAQVRPHSELPQYAAPRQSIWTQVLDAGRQPGTYQPEAPVPVQRDTFIQLEPASHSMTKAFTPHGLLSAGMQDKQDRSAKRQEELARETGGSLVNVPNKPPPPQTGLLGAITAHERERKREGGVGATLTEREREKRLAEDCQRKLDEFQRQQLEMAQSGMMGGQFGMGMNPMMGNPMMMGMNPMMTGAGMMPPGNPMMTGGYMGYPNMMPGYGGQPYMFAAQQAAQAAYQQAMMAFSAAGSHVGDGMHGGPSPMVPMMTGGGMGFDPRMSMMGMPMMASPMPVGGMGMMGGMGGMGGMGSMGMQMTGGSAFDARFSPSGVDEVLRPPGVLGGQPRQGNNSSRNSSAGQGSPARPADTADRSRDIPKT